MNKKRSFIRGLLICCIFYSVFASNNLCAETKKIIIKGGDRVEELNILLGPTVPDYGPYELIPSQKLSQGRAIASLVDNTLVNFISFSTNIEREKLLLPIMLPLNDGLLGYRTCFIREGTQHQFDAIRSLEDWHQSGLIIGTGSHWSDTPILESNNIKLRKAISRDLLVEMLIAGRFDCFPRGLDEIPVEAPQYESKGIVIEKNLLFVYPFRSLYFVSRKDPGLAERIKVGYQRALDNGTWQAHIEKEYQYYEELTQQLNFKDQYGVGSDSRQAASLPVG